MRLSELNAKFLGSGGPGISNADGSPAPKREGVGVIMDCPCGSCEEFHKLYVSFANPIDGGPTIETGSRPRWQRTGDTIDTLTLSPSIQRIGGCNWHGYIENGATRNC